MNKIKIDMDSVNKIKEYKYINFVAMKTMDNYKEKEKYVCARYMVRITRKEDEQSDI